MSSLFSHFVIIAVIALLSLLHIDAFVPPQTSHVQKRPFLLRRAVSTLPASTSKDGQEGTSKKRSKRERILNKIGFKRLSKEAAEVRKAEAKAAKQDQQTFEIKTVPDLEAYFADQDGRFRDEDGETDYDRRLRSLKVEGDTQIIGSADHPQYVHPVAKLLHERKKNGSRCSEGQRPDGCKVALIVEGGGMRGCVSAGMVCALHHLGLRDTVDVVYGSSAGSIIGAYFITGQLPWYGPEVYYDCLTTAGKEFIDTSRLLRSLGFGLVDPRLLKDVLTRPNNGKPVLNLPYLLETTLQYKKPLDWNKFIERQKVQPLNVIASGLKSEKPIVMSLKDGHFSNLQELSKCMHASCLLPGIAGPVMNIKLNSSSKDKANFVIRNNFNDPDYEPMGDALLYGPIPYDTAIENGATHVIAIRSRPDGTDVTGKGGVFERLIFRRFFLKKNKLPGAFKHMSQQLHKKLYARNVIELNEAAYSTRDHLDTSKPHLLTLALPPGSEEVTRLETGREPIFEGVRRGFARAYDALVEDPSERGRGHIVARQYFPDEILDYDPNEIIGTEDSAFELYMKKSGASPKSWKDSRFVPDRSMTSI